MFRDLLAAVRERASGTRARDDVAAVSRFHRVQSSPGYDEAARWLESRLAAEGIPFERVETPADGTQRPLGMLQQRGWECRRAVAVLEDGAARETLCDTDAESLAVVLRSTSARGRFPLRAVGEGTRAEHYAGVDVKGAVVLASGDVHRVHERAVRERGAAGLLTDVRRLVPPVRRAGDERDALNYTSFWWRERDVRGWGFVVTPETGDRLRARLAEGAPLTLDVTIDARDFATVVPLVTARIGPAGAGEVLVTAHLCHPRTSANDNGSGVAAALETARVLAALEREGKWRPKRAVRFLWMPELSGTHAWLAGDGARATRTVAALNLDMVGQDQAECGSTFLLEHPPCFAASFATELLARIRAEALDPDGKRFGATEYSDVRVAEVPYSGGSDHVTWNDPLVGVPCPMLIQWPDRFYHSNHDTVAHTSPASLALAVRCAATYAGSLAAADAGAVAELATRVERGAERRLLESLEAADAGWRANRERMRGERAIGSLARLGHDAAAIAAARARFQSFAEARGVPARTVMEDGPVYRRTIPAPLDFRPLWWPGLDRLTEAERDELDQLTNGIEGGTTSTELAWAACDGVRPLGEIAALAALESGLDLATGADEAGARGLARYFGLLERMGLVERVRAETGAAPPREKRGGPRRS